MGGATDPRKPSRRAHGSLRQRLSSSQVGRVHRGPTGRRGGL